MLKIVYLLTRRVLGLAVLVFRDDLAKDAELLGHGQFRQPLKCPALDYLAAWL